MAPPVGTLRVGRYFLALLSILVLLYLIVFWPGARHTPKLGLDLEGGTQVIFTAKAPGGKTPSSGSMSQAKQIMEDRVNGSGVTEATVVIQGSDQIVVSIPGSTNTDVSKLGATAALNFRGLVAPPVAVACGGTSTLGGFIFQVPTSAKATEAAIKAAVLGATTKTDPTPKIGAAASGHVLVTMANTATVSLTQTRETAIVAAIAKTLGLTATQIDTAPLCSSAPFQALEKAGVKIPTVDTAFEALPADEQTAISTALGQFDCASGQGEVDNPKSYYVACDSSGQVHLLGTVIVAGKQVSSASAVAPGGSSGQLNWTVSLALKSSGQTAWAKYTSAHNIGGADSTTADPTTCSASATPCADFVAFTLDGVVISTPVNESAINGGNTQISGSFNSKTAKDLANKLKYGALPLTFKADTAQTVSATLGTSQLKSGLLAGGIGLVLVVIYSLLYYRALGFVTIASLIVSGGLTYGALVMLGTQIGFTLSLAGIAGFIVAIGITADSFVVFFERIKDEVHDGRSVRVAIPRAWTRARRTILSADTVSFLAAAVLYYFAAGDVRGFAFTLGLSTILDLIVVFLFTHPLVSWLSRKRAFGSARFTGLDSVREGGIAPNAKPEKAEKAAKPAKAVPDEPRVSAGTIRIEKSAIAVLEKENEVDEDTDDDGVEDTADEGVAEDADEDVAEDSTAVIEDDGSAAETEPQAADEIEDADETTEDDTADDDAAVVARKRTKPAPGSAAERAAARRARLREKGSR